MNKDIEKIAHVVGCLVGFCIGLGINSFIVWIVCKAIRVNFDISFAIWLTFICIIINTIKKKNKGE